MMQRRKRRPRVDRDAPAAARRVACGRTLATLRRSLFLGAAAEPKHKYLQQQRRPLQRSHSLHCYARARVNVDMDTWKQAVEVPKHLCKQHVGSTEGVRWKGYPSKLLHAAAFRVAKTP